MTPDDAASGLAGLASATGCEIVACDTPALKRAVYAFRYRVYVEQMRRRQLHADHARGLIEEPMDRDGRNFAAIRGGEVLATIRANDAEDPTMRYYRRLYRLDALGLAGLSRVQVTTKLMLRPDLRRSTLGARLLLHYGADAYRRGVAVDVMDCNAPLIPMFEKLGYHSYCGWVFHKEYGTVRPMLAALDAVEYIVAIGSVLADQARATRSNGADGGYALLKRVATAPGSAALRPAFMRFIGTG